MKGMPRKIQLKHMAWLTACLAGVILLAFFTPWSRDHDSCPVSINDTVQKYRIERSLDGLAPQAHEKMETASSREMVSALENREAFVAWARQSLKNDLGETIGSRRTQASLMKLRMFLAKQYPEEWIGLFRDIVEGAFPDRAADIFDFIARKDSYNMWLEDNKHHLATLDYLEIKSAISARQSELFGQDGENMKTDMMNDVLGILSEAYDTSIDTKLSVFSQMILDHDESPAVPGLDESKYYMSRAFFRMDSVQENLKSLSDSEREQAINSVRQALGYSEEDIEKLALIDAKKDESWQLGYQYMEERKALTLACEGEELERKLHDLQDSYFGKQARTIRAEEASGFFRFQRPRIYGSN